LSHNLGTILGMCLSSLASPGLSAHALASTAQLGHRHRLVELGDGAQHLPDQLGGGRVVEESIGAVGSNQVDAALTQSCVAHLLHHQIAREAVGGLDDNCADTVALDPLKHGGETGARLNRIRAAYGRVVELTHNLVAAMLSKRLNRLALPLIAVLVGTNI